MILYVGVLYYINIYRLNRDDDGKVFETVYRVNISLLPVPENSGGRVILYIIIVRVYDT